jgi:DNA gyrase subunit B
MPELLRAGHLFIAQPPLYKVTRGRSEIYLKDEAALEDHLVSSGLGQLTLDLGGEQRTGADLGLLVAHARRMKRLMAYVPRRYPSPLVEALALAGALDPDTTDIEAAAARLTGWLNRGVADAGAWTATPAAEGGYVVRHVDRGVTEAHVIDRTFLNSAEARKLHALAAEQAEAWMAPGRIGDETIRRPSELLQAVVEAGRKGLSVQRYKGLGEMNPDQLWETTLDINARSLLQVKVKEVDAAGELFNKLMGDEVEPRRQFIEDNALNVRNLDV